LYLNDNYNLYLDPNQIENIKKIPNHDIENIRTKRINIKGII